MKARRAYKCFLEIACRIQDNLNKGIKKNYSVNDRKDPVNCGHQNSGCVWAIT
jgi:hypothetical protein